MKGGIGYSWFKLTLVDQAKHYAQLEGRLEEAHYLISEMEGPVGLIGNLLEQQHIGKLENQNLIGTLKAHELIGILGGGRDE